MNTVPPEIRVCVQSLGIADYTPFYVSPFITVETFKRIVCEKNHFPLMTTRLLFKGKSLISTSTLYDYKISNNDMIYAVPTSRVPPQYLPIWFNINIQSTDAQIFHYRTNGRDYDRQLDSMRMKTAELQEMCASALLRIALTQNLLERNDNPHSTKIKSAVTQDDNPFQPLTASQTASRNYIPPKLPAPTTYEERLSRFKHGCRLAQGKISEFVKTLKNNLEHLHQYHLLMNTNGEMGADFQRVVPYPVPPPLTRSALITNVSHGLAELFGGTPDDNLVPHTVFNFPDGFPTEASLYLAERRTKGESIEGESHTTTDTTNQTTDDTTNSATEASNIAEEVDTTNDDRNNGNLLSIDPYPYGSNIVIPSSNDLFSPPLPTDLTNFVVQQAKNDITQQQILRTHSNSEEESHNLPHSRRPIRSQNRRHSGTSNMPLNMLMQLNNNFNGEARNNRHTNAETEKKLSFEEFFTADEIAQMERDHNLIDEAERNGNIPGLEPHYYQSRIVDGY